jgi:hypothetical protein
MHLTYCVSVVKSNEGKVMVKRGFISSWHNVFHCRYSLVYSVLVLIFLLILIYLFIVVIVFVVSLCGVSFIVCVDLCAVFCLSVVCYFG